VVAPLLPVLLDVPEVVVGAVVEGSDEVLLVADWLVCDAVLVDCAWVVEVACSWESVAWVEVACARTRPPLASAALGIQMSRAASTTAASRWRGGMDRCVELDTRASLTGGRLGQTGASPA
jgi:hypothetical protein